MSKDELISLLQEMPENYNVRFLSIDPDSEKNCLHHPIRNVDLIDHVDDGTVIVLHAGLQFTEEK